MKNESGRAISDDQAVIQNGDARRLKFLTFNFEFNQTRHNAAPNRPRKNRQSDGISLKTDALWFSLLPPGLK
jgi:hypothetical protein